MLVRVSFLRVCIFRFGIVGGAYTTEVMKWYARPDNVNGTASHPRSSKCGLPYRPPSSSPAGAISVTVLVAVYDDSKTVLVISAAAAKERRTI